MSSKHQTILTQSNWFPGSMSNHFNVYNSISEMINDGSCFHHLKYFIWINWEDCHLRYLKIDSSFSEFLLLFDQVNCEVIELSDPEQIDRTGKSEAFLQIKYLIEFSRILQSL
jgi:hypothetical protein